MNIVALLYLVLSGGLLISGIVPPIGVINPFEGAGAVSGNVTPPGSRSKIVAIHQGVPVDSSLADINTGKFIIGGLTPGLYDVKIMARTEGYGEILLYDVNIEPNRTTEIGIIQLPESAETDEL
jgi:hypothetical protein